MSTLYQPPLMPGFGTNSGSPMATDYAPTRNPFFAVSSQFLPRNLHDVVRWARFITTQSPVTTEVIRKLSTYPITDFVVDTKDPSKKEDTTDLFKALKLKTCLHAIGFEYFTVGNVFISLYFPIARSLICPTCNTAHNCKALPSTKVEAYKYKGMCPVCSNTVTFKVSDTKNMDIKKINIVSWDPLNIQVDYNPITGEAEYYYNIPNDIKKRIQRGDRHIIDSMPWEFVEAVKNNMGFKFNEGKIFHLKHSGAGHIINGVAVPPLISQFGLVFYQATLRSANESIASDFMAPMRVIFPQAATGNSDPVVSMSMNNFVGRMQDAIIRHKNDKSHVLIAPVPIGYEAISGEGRNLLVAQELLQAEESLLLSMGVSRELLSGQTNWTSSTVGLRLLSNTLSCYVDQIEELMEWILTSIARYRGVDAVPTHLAPFKLTDDDNLRQTLLTLCQNGNAALSDLYESFGMDYEKVLENTRNDAVAKAISDAKLKVEVEKALFLQTKGIDGGEENDQYKQALSKAQAIAEQLMGADESTKRQVLNQLRLQDYGQYLMVSKLLEEYNKANEAQAALQQGMQNPDGSGGPAAGGAPGQDSGQQAEGGGPGGVEGAGPQEAVGEKANPSSNSPQ